MPAIASRLDPAGANKATHFIQTCCQAGLPILYLQNTTGYIVGKASEEAGMKRKGQEVDRAQIDAVKAKIVANFERQQSAFVTSALMLDDGIIDPRDTRNVLGCTLSICKDGDARSVRPVQFGVARP